MPLAIFPVLVVVVHMDVHTGIAVSGTDPFCPRHGNLLARIGTRTSPSVQYLKLWRNTVVTVKGYCAVVCVTSDTSIHFRHKYLILERGSGK